MNTHEITRYAADLAQWFRYSLDSHLFDCKHASGPEKDLAKVRGWQMWKLGSWGKIPQILKFHHDASVVLSADPWRIEADLRELFELCQPQPHGNENRVVLTPSESIRLLTAIHDNTERIAAELRRRSSSEYGNQNTSLGGTEARLLLRIRAREIESQTRDR